MSAPRRPGRTCRFPADFVEMLRRSVQLSRNQGAVTPSRRRGVDAGALPAARRRRRADAADARMPGRSSTGRGEAPVTIENPPGLYGSEEGFVALNLLNAGCDACAAGSACDAVAGHRYALRLRRIARSERIAGGRSRLPAAGLDTHRGVLDGRRLPRRATQGRTRRRRSLVAAGCRRLLFAAPPRADDRTRSPATRGGRRHLRHPSRLCRDRRAAVDPISRARSCRPHRLPDR